MAILSETPSKIPSFDSNLSPALREKPVKYTSLFNAGPLILKAFPPPSDRAERKWWRRKNARGTVERLCWFKTSVPLCSTYSTSAGNQMIWFPAPEMRYIVHQEASFTQVGLLQDGAPNCNDGGRMEKFISICNHWPSITPPDNPAAVEKTCGQFRQGPEEERPSEVNNGCFMHLLQGVGWRQTSFSVASNQTNGLKHWFYKWQL